MRATFTKSSATVALTSALMVLLLATGCSNSDQTDKLTEGAPSDSSTTPSATASAGTEDCVAAGPFVPKALTIDGLVDKAPVIAVPRDKFEVPGILPIEPGAEDEFAFDKPGIQPGSSNGSVLLNTHTWDSPEGMGDRMLESVDVGTAMTLYDKAGNPVCYEVTERKEVAFDFDATSIYTYTGPEQLVFVVCSGKRLKPGVWTHRTLWFARPVGAVAG